MGERDTGKGPPLKGSAMVGEDTERLREYALLVSNLLHDLRTPLGSIAGGASVLDQYSDNLDEAAKSRICDGIMEQTRRLDSLFTALGALARARTDTLQREARIVELNELLRGLWAVDPNSGGLPGDTSLLREEVLVFTDPTVIRVLLTSMLGLAALFAPDNGRPALSLALDGGTVTIAIESGIRDDGHILLEKLLEGRASDAGTRLDPKAAAISLAAIQEVVHSLGGDFDIRYDDGRLGQTVSLKTTDDPDRAG